MTAPASISLRSLTCSLIKSSSCALPFIGTWGDVALGEVDRLEALQPILNAADQMWRLVTHWLCPRCRHNSGEHAAGPLGGTRGHYRS